MRQTRLRQLVKRVTNFQGFLFFPLLPLLLSLKVVTGQPCPGDQHVERQRQRMRGFARAGLAEAVSAHRLCSGDRGIPPPAPASGREPCASFGSKVVWKGVQGEAATTAPSKERGRGGEER